MRLLTCATVAAAVLGLTSGALSACGAQSDCPVATGDYRVALPSVPDGSGKMGAIVLLHGYNSSPEDMMKFQPIRDMANRLGIALIVPRGMNRSWNLPGAFPPARDDVAFIHSVVADAERNLLLDRDRVMIAGFSQGASMTWYIACAEGRRYAGYAAIAGSFWEPYVETCALPLPYLYHIHGTADETVPMKGRALPMATQGDTYKSFALLRRLSSCQARLEPEPAEGELSCSRQSCGGAEQELCLHNGGHELNPTWIERAWTRLAKARGGF